MFKNLKIGVKLGASFAAVLLILVVISTVSLMSLSGMNSEVDNMVNDKYPKTVWANNVIDNINQIARSMRNTLLMKDVKGIRGEIETIQESRKVILENIDKLEKTITSDEGKAKLKDVLEARLVYVAGQDKFLEMLDGYLQAKTQSADEAASRHEAAVNYLLEDIRPMQLNYMKAVATLIDFQQGLMTEAGQAQQAEYERTRTMLVTLAVIAVVLTVWWWTS